MLHNAVHIDLSAHLAISLPRMSEMSNEGSETARENGATFNLSWLARPYVE